MERQRLDLLLVSRGLAQSRERAQALILAGRVLVNEQKLEKPGATVAPEAALRLLGDDLRYVSRGGLKLEGALKHWNIALEGRLCLDIGASTGGFTDCMLQHGASRVHAVDTGYGQMAHKIRTDSRVTLAERTNARLLEPGSLPQDAAFLAMDVSFISATLVLPPVLAAAGWTQDFTTLSSRPERGEAEGPAVPPARLSSRPERSETEGPAAPPTTLSSRPERSEAEGPAVPPVREAVILIKPQFEAGREAVGKGGIVRHESDRQFAIERVRACVQQCGGTAIEVIPSPITGAEGNVEYLIHTHF